MRNLLMQDMLKSKQRRSKGAVLAEFAAVMALMFPVLMLILFVVLEMAQAYLIKDALSQAARQAARDLAIVYGQDPTIQFSRANQDSTVFSKIQIPNVVNSAVQFSNPVWNSAASPPTVSVSVSYTSGKNGLPVFPNPDPLSLGSSFSLSGSSTYRLE